MLLVRTPTDRFWRDLWVRVAVAGALLVTAIFLGYEVVERTFLAGASPATLYVLHLIRGLGTSFLLATLSFLVIWKARGAYESRLTQELVEARSELADRERELAEARRDARYQASVAGIAGKDELSLEESVVALQRQRIARALERAGGRRETAAAALGLSPATLYRHLQRLGLKGYAVEPRGTGGRPAEATHP
jgi:hypothetical protein